jgi:DnaJ-class molecular chaperone
MDDLAMSQMAEDQLSPDCPSCGGRGIWGNYPISTLLACRVCNSTGKVIKNDPRRLIDITTGELTK